MLEARRVAVVGASPRPDSFGRRLVSEVTRSTASLDIELVNPHYPESGGRPCRPSLDDIDGPVDLVLLGVGDAALEEQVSRAVARGDRAAVVYGNAHEVPVPGRHLVAPAAGHPCRRCRHGPVRGWLHGLREPGPRPAGGGLRGARSAAERAGGLDHALRFRLFGLAADPAALRLSVAVSSGQEIVTPGAH